MRNEVQRRATRCPAARLPPDRATAGTDLDTLPGAVSENASREFSSWKEIASRLGVSVRTAQLWAWSDGSPPALTWLKVPAAGVA